MKIRFNVLFKSIIVIAVITVALIIAQMWFSLFSEAIFWKMIVTLFLLGGLASFLLAVKEDMSGEQKLRDEKYLD